MKQYNAKNILNIAIAGHSGSGKTSLAEAIIYTCGGSERLGKVSEGNTILDCDPEEIKRKRRNYLKTIVHQIRAKKPVYFPST